MSIAAEQLKLLWMVPREFENKFRCTDKLVTSKGIPCKHRIATILNERKFFVLEDFHEQWRLHGEPKFETREGPGFLETPSLTPEDRFRNLPKARQIELLEFVESVPLNPQPQLSKGRPKKHDKSATSTRRDPTLIEHRTRRPPTCGACSQSGLPASGHKKCSPLCPSRPGPSSGDSGPATGPSSSPANLSLDI
ncbi:hypothetical protein DFS34DRAFT_682475 [Phlyctochytrium arcticum]|nr:hypothetical protein DFS34DRAFT_682475 [Phlyctochytrium arcticum]